MLHSDSWSQNYAWLLMTNTNTPSLAAKIAALTPNDGRHGTGIDDLCLLRVSSPTPPTPVVYSPKLFVVAQGSKDVIAGTETKTCDAFQYLLLTVSLPIHGKIVQATPSKPFLALNIGLDMAVAADVLQQMDPKAPIRHEEKWRANRGIQANPLDNDLTDALHRLLDALANAERARILGALALREIYYLLLSRKEGDMLRAFILQDRHSFRIARVLDYIQENLHETLSVEVLADKANMSQSSFHEHFKTVTDTSPQQYIKSMRLDQARRYIVEQGLSVSDAAYQVGYASTSQFSREFKRLFGVSPRDAAPPQGGYTGL